MTLAPSAASTELEALLKKSAYLDYVYSYPHKTAYRSFDPPLALGDLWQEEQKNHLFAYVHIPYCEMRCGFCNLFTATDIRGETHERYIRQLEEQIVQQRSAIGDCHFDQLAIGGGTPTILSPDLLLRLFEALRNDLAIDLSTVPSCIEASPRTATAERINVVRDAGFQRVSIGIQSLHPHLLKNLKRPETSETMHQALSTISAGAFPCFNVDLIYGIPGQKNEDISDDIDAAIQYGCNEIYLYPLYIRPGTLLGNGGVTPGSRFALYTAAREHLANLGWHQMSMRGFRAPDQPTRPSRYRCQQDGMLGLGMGARSYTDKVHYSYPYAVEQGAIRSLLATYLHRSPESFHDIEHGIVLDPEDQRRRFVILSLLDSDLDSDAYHRRFERSLAEDFPELEILLNKGLARASKGAWTLTSDGLAVSDVLGHWLFSQKVRGLMDSYAGT